MNPPRCLVLTEDAAVLRWLRELLTRLGADMVVASSAPEARQLLRTDGCVDVVVATLTWPDADVDLRSSVRAIGDVVMLDRFVSEDALQEHLERLREYTTKGT